MPSCRGSVREVNRCSVATLAAFDERLEGGRPQPRKGRPSASPLGASDCRPTVKRAPIGRPTSPPCARAGPDRPHQTQGEKPQSSPALNPTTLTQLRLNLMHMGTLRFAPGTLQSGILIKA